MKKFILIDPGHGGTDVGASKGNVFESAVNRDIASRLGPMLFAEGFDVAYTRSFDQTTSLATRVSLAEVFKADLFLSLHCNAAANERASGIEFFTSPGQTESDLVAEEIYKALQTRFSDTIFRADTSDGDHDKEARFYVLQKTTCPAVLIEMGFITNKHDRQLLSTDEHRLRLALAIACGVVGWARPSSSVKETS